MWHSLDKLCDYYKVYDTPAIIWHQAFFYSKEVSTKKF